METKKMYKFFFLSDFKEEEAFLRKQHQQGWKFVYHNDFFKYTFEKVSPADYIYGLDYQEEDQEEELYLQLYQDCGWEYLQKSGQFYYFRKKKDDIVDTSIFSDNESLKAMYKKIRNRQLQLCIVFLPINVHLLSSSNWSHPIPIFLTILNVLILGLYFRTLFKLQKMLHQ